MKKLFLSALFAFLIIFSAQSVFAQQNDHVIRTWHTEVNLRADNVAEVTENITVDYLERKHGFYRTIPYIVNTEKKIDGEAREMAYRVRINNVHVTGAPFNKNTDNGCVILQIGDEDKKVFGEVSYTITYTYDMGDDRVTDYDELFFTLLGADNEATVESFSFNISFEKPLPNSNAIQFFSGDYGSIIGDNVEYTASQNAVSGKTKNAVSSGEAVTIYARLPEGYFENVRVINPIVLYLILGAAVAISLFCIYIRLAQAREKPVVTVEFTAPEGISSAEVGYIIDSTSEDKDILSLIVWFADKGFISIDGEEESLTLSKLKELPANSPAYMLTFFSALFDSGSSCVLNEAGVSMYEGLSAAKLQLSSEFTGKRKLYSSKWSVISCLLPIAAAIIYITGALIATDSISISGIAGAIFGALALFLSGIIAAVASTQWAFAGMGKRAAFSVGILAPLAIGGGLSIITSTVSVAGFAFYASILFIACALAALTSSQLSMPTQYNTDISGRLLGLKSFIQQAELERLKMLAEENPQYFYSVLPYAYVFGLTDVWVKQFEGIAVPAPMWYGGAGHMSYFNIYWLTRGINRAHSHMVSEVAAKNMESGGKGGTSFGGGGGFSGGGFGGGGSGSW